MSALPRRVWRDTPSAREVDLLVAEVLRLGCMQRDPSGAFVVRLAEIVTGRPIRYWSGLAVCGCYSYGTIVIRWPRTRGAAPDHDVAFTIAHELGHHAIRVIRGWDFAAEEEIADAFARALLGRDARDKPTLLAKKTLAKKRAAA